MRKVLAITFILSMVARTTATGQRVSGTEMSSFAVFTAILTPFLASIFVLTLYKYLKDYSAYVGVFSGLISFISVVSLIGSKGAVFLPWIPSLGVNIEFYVDGLSILIALLASGIGVLVFLYSRYYMGHGSRKRKFYTVLTAFMGSMIGLVFSSNLILLFVFWELTSICSFLLISHNQELESALKASKKSLIITVGSGLLLLIGFVILGESLGTYSLVEILSMGDVVETLQASSLYIPVLGLIGVGAAAKSAQVPLHIWLPDAMEAPTPVSAFLHSATMVKAGVYLLGRLRPVLMRETIWSLLFVSMGILTMTVAALMAFRSERLKELLAYSTASHLGLIVAGFGIPGVLGAETASFHIFNHAVFKASLFMIAGIVLHEAGTQKISELSGLRNQWPILNIIATVSALSMAGIPLLNGFYSKELLYESTLHLATNYGGFVWVLPGLAVFASIFTLMYSFRFLSVFYGQKISIQLEKIPKTALVSPSILASIVILAGLKPSYFIENFVYPALQTVSNSAHGMSVHVIPVLNTPFLMSLVTILLGVTGYYFRGKVLKTLSNLTSVDLLHPSFYYRAFLKYSDKLSDIVVQNVETGLLRTYVIWVLVFASVSGITGFILPSILPSVSLQTQIPVVVVLGTAVASVYAVLRSQTYISSVLTLSILGFMVSIFYLLMDAPDLVMTQLVVESLSLIIFLLVLNKIPEYTKDISFSRKYRDLTISGTAGLMVFLSVIYSTMEETPAKLADYYINNALPGSGGSNVVNVILVDFRGLDTMGEISVIVMAGLAILMLFNMRGEQE